MEKNDEFFVFDDQIESRSISAENPNGDKGGGSYAEIPADQKNTHPSRDLGPGWKVKPCLILKKGETVEIANIKGSGEITHIWMGTDKCFLRDYILRFYWDGAEKPSVECPMGDFFFEGWNRPSLVNSKFVKVNPSRSLNCYWPMPFKKSARITVENRGEDDVTFFYQINFSRKPIPKEALYFHAQFRRTNPLPYKENYVILDNVHGKGKYVGTYMCYAPHNTGWWGEGEVKVFLDGDDKAHPTLNGTGTEDYFLGAWNFENPDTHEYQDYSNDFAGFCVIKNRQQVFDNLVRFSMYRIHYYDAIYFHQDIRITMQSLGWKEGPKFHPQTDDISSVAYFYLDKPLDTESVLPSQEIAEVVQS
jgi:hypothetical protein